VAPVIAETKQPSTVHRMRWMFWAVALALGIGIGVAIALVSRSGSTPAGAGESAVETWGAGVRRAPAFTLLDQNGKPVSLAELHGRPVIVTFIDPLCRNFCPREASILTAAAAQLGPNAPAIVSVSVDPWGDSPANFRLDKLHWRLGPGWRWGTGTYAELAKVWSGYYVGVAVTKKTIAGVTVRYITHTGAAYLIDGRGYERALFLYPFDTAQVVSAAKTMLSGNN
jgi:protein SCO1